MTTGNNQNNSSDLSNQEKCTKECSRRDFVTMSAIGLGVVGAASAAWPLVDSMNPSADVLAVSATEVDVSNMQPGDELRVLWRGKPVFIKKRTKEEIELAQNTAMSELKDPESDKDRVLLGREEFLVLVGICTHLGCVPKGSSGDFDGWFCPCHGSHYDSSGRVRKGPAPKNLAIPPYQFVSDKIIRIG